MINGLNSPQPIKEALFEQGHILVSQCSDLPRCARTQVDVWDVVSGGTHFPI